MTFMHPLEIASPAFLSIICWLRVCKRRQPMGSLIVGCTTLAAAVAAAYDADRIAITLEIVGIVIAGMMILNGRREPPHQPERQ